VRRARALVELCRDDPPTVVVADEVDAGAQAAAELLGVPFVSVVVLAAGGFVRPEVVGDVLATSRAQLGLEPDPPAPAAVVAPIPPTFRDPAWPLPAEARYVRPSVLEVLEVPDATDEPDEPVWGSGRPRVLVTLGTAFELESGDLFARLHAAVAPFVGGDVLMTVGRHPDPASLGPPLGHVRVERFVPQRRSLRGCDAVVTHGGSGTVVGALALGVPLVVLAMGADQPHNARRVEALGVGRALDPMTASSASIRAAIEDVLASGATARAAAIAGECAALPTADDVVARLAVEVAPR
jgi:UDP:flavonoid glycosyltransferase YjiC (YdhE family)